MAKTAIDEVEVLRFFETEPLDKATVLFNIVADKMQARLRGNHPEVSPIQGRRRRIGKTPGAEAAEQPCVE
jgi:hypothetical protein